MRNKYDVYRFNSRTRTAVVYTECDITYSSFQNEIKSKQTTWQLGLVMSSIDISV